MNTDTKEPGGPVPVKAIVIVYSYHHHNTEKIAHVIADVLDAPVKMPQEVNPEEFQEYDLAGFGSGIYSAQHHESLLELINTLPQVSGRKALIFSTFGAPAALFDGARLRDFIKNNHSALREKLQSRGYAVVDEFSCPGFNTNSFLKYFGGLNKGRPDAEDLRHAQEFAEHVKQLTKCRN